uniref:Uncharacterized protein n=1 Tax=Nelumbo nucifera TaxID=4432 RepID=A0A822XYK7_NELNU|nr:TPA_asm: hypothetical protein HUJ06_025308 [Nelumbo nucifera]
MTDNKNKNNLHETKRKKKAIFQLQKGWGLARITGFNFKNIGVKNIVVKMPFQKQENAMCKENNIQRRIKYGSLERLWSSCTQDNGSTIIMPLWVRRISKLTWLNAGPPKYLVSPKISPHFPFLIFYSTRRWY